MCYKDRTFCASKGCVNACGRKMTEQEQRDALLQDLPISVGLFCEEVNLEKLNAHIERELNHALAEQPTD